MSPTLPYEGQIPARYQIVHMHLTMVNVVMFGRDLTTGEEVVLKAVRPEYRLHPPARENFLDGCAVWLALDAHPHVLPVARVERVDEADAIFLVTPWITPDGQVGDVSLKGRITGEPSLAMGWRLDRALEIVWAMRSAAQSVRGLVHRDLKPENVYLNGDRALVADFDYARSVAELKRQAEHVEQGLAEPKKAHHLAGTPAYRAPEMWQPNNDSQKSPDSRADIYSFGCMLYELVSGQVAALASDPVYAAQLVRENRREEYFRLIGESHLSGRIQEAVDDLPDALQSMVKTCLAMARDDRYPDWASVEEALRMVYAEIAGHDAPDSPEITPVTDAQRAETARSWYALGLDYLSMTLADKARAAFTTGYDIARAVDDTKLQAMCAERLTAL